MVSARPRSHRLRHIHTGGNRCCDSLRGQRVKRRGRVSGGDPAVARDAIEEGAFRGNNANWPVQAAGVPLEKVTVHNHLLGGGFGRRLEADMVDSAVRIAKHVDAPIKVVWTRVEDIRHDVYRPVYRDVISATLSNGKITAWKYRVTGSSIMARWFPAGFQKGIDIDAVDSAIDIPYDIPNLQVEYVRAEPRAVPTGFCQPTHAPAKKKDWHGRPCPARPASFTW